MAEDPSDGRKGKWKGSKGSSTGNAWRSIAQFLLIFLVLVAVTALVLWLVFRPRKPKFSLVSAAVFDLNTTSPPFISTTMQFTIVAINPNQRVSVYYDRLSAFVSYKNQMITPQQTLPPLHQYKDSTVSLSPVLGGLAVPVSLEVANGILIDMEGYGLVQFRLVVQGRVKWKVGPFKTSYYHLYVNCDMLLGLKKGVAGQVPLLGINHDSDQDHHSCHVDF
ncbi:NDR1/HIN1-like protein 12 [Apium graveolens]|uniref:NDR1/HIN1-like protein 12 n=1 Tax=Apium graveolens TaxID=4045 RepID=UPI003D797D13